MAARQPPSLRRDTRGPRGYAAQSHAAPGRLGRVAPRSAENAPVDHRLAEASSLGTLHRNESRMVSSCRMYWYLFLPGAYSQASTR